MGKLPLFVYSVLLFLSVNSFGQLIPEDFLSFSKVYEQTLADCKKREYANSEKTLNDWISSNPQSEYRQFAGTQLERVKSTNGVFDRIKGLSPVKLTGIQFKIGNTNATITGVEKDTLKIKMELSSGTSKNEDVNITKLPALSIYYILAKASPETSLEDTSILLLADQNFKMANSILIKMKKGGTNIDSQAGWLREWYNFPRFSAAMQELENTESLIKAGSFDTALTKIAQINKSISAVEELNALFKSVLRKAAENVKSAEEEALKKELAAFIDFPVKPDQHKKVTCVEFPQFKYDVYLPPQYDHKGKTFLPIMYTFSPGGGGMVGHFKKIAKELGIILIGNLESKNNTSYDNILGSFHAMVLDVRQRIHFDANAQMSSGMSGGGSMAYYFNRRAAPLIAASIPMGSWLGGDHNELLHWHKEGLLVARTHGNNDGGAKGWIAKDGAYLKKWKVEVRDWEFPGGHVSAPYEIQKEVFDWILKTIKKEPESARLKANEDKNKWMAYLSGGDTQKTFNECMKVLIESPRTWRALAAQKVIDKLFTLPPESLKNTFSKINDLPGDFEALDFVKFIADSAYLAGDEKRVLAAHEAIMAHKKGYDRWGYTAMWSLLGSPNEEARHPEKVIPFLEKIKSPSLDEEINLGTAYALAGKMDKAKELLKKVQKQVDKKVKHSSSHFEFFKNQVK